MKHLTIGFITVCAALLATSCGTSPDTSTDATPPDMHTSSIALDWAGTYQGMTPCASCPGILTSLTLSDEMTYSLNTSYVGEDDTTFTSSGTFTWDDTGNVAVLQGIENASNRYKVVEGAVIQLDLEGNEITGDLSQSYRLAKVDSSAVGSGESQSLQNVPAARFVLVEIMGKPYTATEGEREAFIQFMPVEMRAAGNSGCNSFTGSYELKDGSRIRFSQMASTKMACMDMTIEQEFLNILQSADSYWFDGATLVLNRARMAPLARFEIEG